MTVETATPSAVIDRISLVLDAFDGPGRLTLAQIVRRTGLPRSSAHRCRRWTSTGARCRTYTLSGP